MLAFLYQSMMRGKSGKGMVNANRSRTRLRKTTVSTVPSMLSEAESRGYSD